MSDHSPPAGGDESDHLGRQLFLYTVIGIALWGAAAIIFTF